MIHSEISEYELSIFRGLAELFYAERVGHKFRCLHIDIYVCSMSVNSCFTYLIPRAEFHLPKCRRLVSFEMLKCTGNICMALADMHNV